MDLKLASGDSMKADSNIDKATDQEEGKHFTAENTTPKEEDASNIVCPEGNSKTETDNENDLNVTERIASCKKIIESLKQELTEEKAKLREESKSSNILLKDNSHGSGCNASHVSSCNKYVNDTLSQSDTNYLYSCTVDNKLFCDDNLMEYEKQLQRYQDTLTMAQTEKKNAIRKQMLAKAYKLKLMEVENQCNIELLRVKQSLQCLEPLQMIVNKWKVSENNPTCDLNNYDLISRYPEVNPILPNDVNIFTDDEKSEFVAFNEDA